MVRVKVEILTFPKHVEQTLRREELTVALLLVDSQEPKL